MFNQETRQYPRIDTTPKALKAFAGSLPDEAFIIMEASGGYERPLIDALFAKDISYTRVNPRQARKYARAKGRLSKADRVDARMLCQMGRALKLTPDRANAPEREHLAALMPLDRPSSLSALLKGIDKLRPG